MSVILGPLLFAGAGDRANITTTTEPKFSSMSNATSGVFLHRTDVALPGLDHCAEITAVATSRYGNKTLASRANTYFRGYIDVATGPDANSRFLEVLNGTNAAPAFQLGLSTSQALQIRDATTVRDTSIVLPDGRYRIDGTALGAGDLTMVIYDEDHLYDTGAAFDTIGGAFAATTMANIHLGNITAVSQPLRLHRWVFDNSALPAQYVPPAPPPPALSGVSGNLRWAAKVGPLLKEVRWAVKD